MTTMASLEGVRSNCVRLSVAVAMLVCAMAPAANAADCGNDAEGFDAWLTRLKRTAVTQGISPAAVNSALAGVSYDPTVIRLDRSQRSFKLSFEEFYARRVGPALIRRGQTLMRTHAATLDRIEQRYGVPGPILISIWGLETNYGSDSSGKFSVMRSLATLSYDCRRTEFFTGASARCPAHRRARRPQSRAAARRLGRRDRPHPVHAVGLLQVRGRFRRRRPPRPRGQRGRHAGLHGELPERATAGRPGRAGSPARPTMPSSRTGTRPRSISAPSP